MPRFHGCALGRRIHLTMSWLLPTLQIWTCHKLMLLSGTSLRPRVRWNVLLLLMPGAWPSSDWMTGTCCLSPEHTAPDPPALIFLITMATGGKGRSSYEAIKGNRGTPEEEREEWLRKSTALQLLLTSISTASSVKTSEGEEPSPAFQAEQDKQVSSQ